LNRFGERAIKSGAPLATIEEALVPLYLHHRYQTEAAVKSIGGAYYTYALRGDGQEPYRRVPSDQQRAAVAMVVKTLDPVMLKLPRNIVDMLPPRPYGFGMHRELFDRTTGVVFDAIAPATTAADMTLSLLLNPERAARLVEQNALDQTLPGFSTVLRAIDAVVMTTPENDPYAAEIGRAVQRVYIDQLMAVAANARLAQVRAHATYHLTTLRDALAPQQGLPREVTAHRMLLSMDINRFLERPIDPIRPPGPFVAPPGQPIGMPGLDWLVLSCDAW
jgi:hypothetical protein